MIEDELYDITPYQMSQALKRRQGVGQLGMLTGDPVLSRLGGQMFESAGSDAWREAQDSMQRRSMLARALEEDKERRFRGEFLENQQSFAADQNARDRALQRAIAQIRASDTGSVSLKDVLRYRRDLSRDMTKASLPEIKKGIAQVDAIMAKYPEGTDIPGVGVGAYSPGADARELRGTQASIRNILLKARSGAAVTEPEYERFEQELLGKGVFNIATDTDFRRAWNDFKERVSTQEQGILAGYDPEIVEMWEAEARGAGDTAVPSSESGGDISKMSDEELRAIASGRK